MLYTPWPWLWSWSCSPQVRNAAAARSPWGRARCPHGRSGQPHPAPGQTPSPSTSPCAGCCPAPPPPRPAGQGTGTARYRSASAPPALPLTTLAPRRPAMPHPTLPGLTFGGCWRPRREGARGWGVRGGLRWCRGRPLRPPSSPASYSKQSWGTSARTAPCGGGVRGRMAMHGDSRAQGQPRTGHGDSHMQDRVTAIHGAW